MDHIIRFDIISLKLNTRTQNHVLKYYHLFGCNKLT